MDPSQIGLFALAEQRLAWADQRQAVLAQNIANAATPRFQPSDLPSFASRLASAGRLPLTCTQPDDLPAPGAGTSQSVVEANPHGPDGNGVELDTELMKVADTQTTQSLVTAIYKKYLTMFGEALGHNAAS
ncbi:MAG TPA: flagellar basal body protein [Acetobacteraceae bacterium]|nr:flagellar basal body protein [Acetobacteraceae bacterium]